MLPCSFPVGPVAACSAEDGSEAGLLGAELLPAGIGPCRACGEGEQAGKAGLYFMGGHLSLQCAPGLRHSSGRLLEAWRCAQNASGLGQPGLLPRLLVPDCSCRSAAASYAAVGPSQQAGLLQQATLL